MRPRTGFVEFSMSDGPASVRGVDKIKGTKALTKIAAAVLIVIIVASAAVGFYLIKSYRSESFDGSRRFSAYVVYYPYDVWNNVLDHNPRSNWMEFLNDLELIKSMGFVGVKLHGVDNFYKDNILANTLIAVNASGLKLIIQLIFWPQEQFPSNQTKLDEFVSYVANVSRIAKAFGNVHHYAQYFPWDWSNVSSYKNVVTSPEYKSGLQRIVNAVREEDSRHSIYVISDMLERFGGYSPYDLDGISGVGFNPYTGKANMIDQEYIIIGGNTTPQRVQMSASLSGASKLRVLII